MSYILRPYPDVIKEAIGRIVKEEIKKANERRVSERRTDMQELEKILEEIEKEKKKRMDVIRIEVDPMKIAINREQYKGLRMAEDIIRKHINDGWIPVEERLPEVGEHVLVSFISDGLLPAVAIISENGRWLMLQGAKGFNDVTEYVIAWQPLPEPYCPERSGNK